MLRKSKYFSALLVVAVSVSALIVVQIIWMADSLRLKKEFFREETEKALSQFATQFEDNLFCYEMFTNVKLNKGEGLELLQTPWTVDSNGRKIWRSDTTANPLGLYIDTGEDTLTAFQGLKFNYPVTVQLMVKINSWLDTSTVFERSREVGFSPENGPSSQQFKDFVASHQNPAAFFSDFDIDSMIRRHLLEGGIDLDYEYGVYAEGKEVFVSDDKVKDELANSSIGTVLLEDNNFFEPYSLKLYFPGQYGYLWRSSQLFLVISILIILSLIASFYVFVRFIYRQIQLSQMKNNFVNNMTHEFKTPTANISLALETIDMLNGEVSPKFRKYLRIIREENQRMITNVERILEVSRYSQGSDMQLQRHREDLHEIIKEIVERYSIRVKKENGDFSCKLRAEESEILCDRHHVKNAISNVLDNALKYSPENVNVALETTNRDGQIEIRITDTGIGIDKEDLKKIFDPFFRKDTGNLHNVKGFGLGLSYVRRVIELHHARIDVKSTPGRGSEFILTFPVAIKEPRLTENATL